MCRCMCEVTSRARLEELVKVCSYKCTNERVRAVCTWGCCYLLWIVRGYIHIYISFDLEWVVCYSARDEARTHIHVDRFVLVEN